MQREFFTEVIASPEEVPDLPADELGLRVLRTIVDHQQGHLLNRHDVGEPGLWVDMFGAKGAPQEFVEAVTEAWDWLQLNQLLAYAPADTSQRGYVTRLGHEVLKSADGLGLIRARARIGVEMHPLIATRVRRQFLLGEYEAAALLALKTVEIRVRAVAGLTDSDFGDKLMRRAFGDNGPLIDPTIVASEQKATADLFAGAIGFFKNPSSHREVRYDDPTFAAEVILFADLLLRLVDATEQRLHPNPPDG